MPLDGTSNRMRRQDLWDVVEAIGMLIGGLISVGFIMWMLFWMFSSMVPPAPAHITDPRKGHVWINDSTEKYCDGTTLVYEFDDNGSVTPNSPECASK